jgi:poly-gamma-glutamate synthesis protein (capsule biosynthesis protein)
VAACAFAGPAAGDERAVRFTIDATGDVLTQDAVLESARSPGSAGGYDFHPLLRRLEPRISRAELALCHQEVPMGPGPPHNDNFDFLAPPSLARAQSGVGWDACTTASNHAVDDGAEGLASTIEALHRAGLRHTGTYTTRRASRRTLILRMAGVRLALLSYTEDTNLLTPPEPFSVNLIDRAEILADVRRARRAGADAVLVHLHDTGDFVRPIPAYERRLVDRLTRIDAVAAVIGQGAHIVRPIRFVHGKPVVWGSGDLLSAHTDGEATGIIAELVMRASGDHVEAVKARYVPLHIRARDHAVVAVGRALEHGQANRAALRAKYRRIVARVGRSRLVEPVPARLGAPRG